MRNRPVVHKVGRHKRNGKWVEEFTRGSGERKRPKTVVHKGVFNEDTDMGPHAWTVNFDYPGRNPPGETVLVVAPTYDGVMDEAFDERMFKHWEPYAIEMIDPTLGQFINAVGKGVKKASGLGAKYAITGIRAVGKGTVAAGKIAGKAAFEASKTAGKAGVKFVKFKVTSRLVQQLLEDVYGPPGTRRAAAKLQLQVTYPKYWKHLNLSHDRPPRPKSLTKRKRKKKSTKKKKSSKKKKTVKKPKGTQTIQIQIVP